MNFSHHFHQSSQPSQKSSGFTLIEVMVVTGITVVVMLSAVTIFMTFLLSQARIAQQQKIKTAGDNALKQMGQVLRGARSIEPCESGMEGFEFIDINDAVGEYELDNSSNYESIASISGTNTVYLTPQSVEVTDFSADCSFAHESYFLNINFTLQDTDATALAAQEQSFRGSVSLRN